jgi:hypothetical protein
LAQEVVIHHLERTSSLARSAENYAGLDPALADGFHQSAAWHAQGPGESRRMDAADVSRGTGRDAEHDRSDGRLPERAMSCDSILRQENNKPAGKAGRGGGDARATPA